MRQEIIQKYFFTKSIFLEDEDQQHREAGRK
jgi:hypothetical protein